jgi:hypothetical protein
MHDPARRATGFSAPGGGRQGTLFLGGLAALRESAAVPTLLLAAPIFLAFEIWQLVISERYLGIKQIARHGDPRTLGMSELTAFGWSAALFAYGLWMVLLLLAPFSRVHALCLLAVSATGFALRRNSGIKWVLVILTFEGAVRVGLLVSLFALAWRRF